MRDQPPIPLVPIPTQPADTLAEEAEELTALKLMRAQLNRLEYLEQKRIGSLLSEAAVAPEVQGMAVKCQFLIWPVANPAPNQRVMFWIGPREYVGRYVPRADPDPFIADGVLYGSGCGSIEWYPIPEPARDRILAEDRKPTTGGSETMENTANTTAPQPVPLSIGRIVHYVLRAEDCNRAESEGQHRAAIVTNAFNGLANLTVFLDGVNDGPPRDSTGNARVYSRAQSDSHEPGTWHWPERV